jgi:ABC-type transporter Mla subunit MlaD
MADSSERIAIPLTELSEFAPQLRAVKEYMNRTGDTFGHYHDAMGDQRVVDALEDFVSGWKDGRGDISDQLTGLADMADTVITTVNEFEAELERSLTEGGGEGGGQQPV